MKNVLIFSVLVFFLFSGCKKENPTEPITPSLSNGSLLLKFDRENIPTGVETVTATLFRTGFTSLSTSVNITNDSLATLSFASVPVGIWGLKVDANSSTGTVLFTGQTSLEVIANQITNVNLALQSTGGTTGSVVINVTWGTSSTSWTDYSNNPVLNSINSPFAYGGLGHGTILYDNDNEKFKLWYHDLLEGGLTPVLYAESTDGRSWERMNNNFPVLLPGTASWEAGGVSPGAAIKISGIYYMYYVGYDVYRTSWRTGLAVSSNGINWERLYAQPILAPSGNEVSCFANSVVKVGETYYLYYTAGVSPNYNLNVATSTNGINFQKFPGNPILTSSGGWENSGISEPSVIFENGIFTMIYQNTSDANAAFGMASSVDGVNWQKSSLNPIFRKSNTANGWGSGWIAYPSFIKTPTEYRVYYSGFGNQDPKTRIGYMKKPL